MGRGSVTIADHVAAELPFMRAQAESLMTDAGAAKRPTGETAYDPVEQADVPTYSALFSSPCKIQSRDLQARMEEVGGRTATSVRVELHLPVSTAPLTVGDVWTMTAVMSTSTASVGRAYRVLGPVEKTYPTARRYEVEVIVS